MNTSLPQTVNWRGSIRRKLRLSLLAGAIALTIGVYFMVLSVARQVAQESQDNILTASAISILDSARFTNGQMIVDLPYSALSMLDSVSDERVFYAIRLDDEFLSGYENLPIATSAQNAGINFLSNSFLGDDVRIATLNRTLLTERGQQNLQVSVAQTLTSQQAVISQISRRSLAVGMIVFALLALLSSIIARGTIRPLDRLAASISRRGPEDLRPVAAPVPAEMVSLVTSLNSLMKRLQTSLTRSEDFIAEAAHRVRTPLAIVRTKAEIIGHKANDPATQTAVQEMIHAIDESSRTAEQLLDHAMVTFRLDNLSTTKIDLGQVVQNAVDRAKPLFELRDVSFRTALPKGICVEVDQILVSNALQNLLDNTLKYAPSGSQVNLSLAVDQAKATLKIEDDGPGFPSVEIDTLADRFTRGSNAQEVVGSGLGLTIVREVMDAHGGTLRLTNSQKGGACVQLCFPIS